MLDDLLDIEDPDEAAEYVREHWLTLRPLIESLDGEIEAKAMLVSGLTALLQTRDRQIAALERAVQRMRELYRQRFKS